MLTGEHQRVVELPGQGDEFRQVGVDARMLGQQGQGRLDPRLADAADDDAQRRECGRHLIEQVRLVESQGGLRGQVSALVCEQDQAKLRAQLVERHGPAVGGVAVAGGGVDGDPDAAGRGRGADVLGRPARKRIHAGRQQHAPLVRNGPAAKQVQVNIDAQSPAHQAVQHRQPHGRHRRGEGVGRGVGQSGRLTGAAAQRRGRGRAELVGRLPDVHPQVNDHGLRSAP